MPLKLLAALAIAASALTPLSTLADDKPKTQVSGRVQTGAATYYAQRFEGRRTANGETFRNDGLTAAHATLPFGTTVLVTCLERGRSVVVRITDRLPAKQAIIDLTQKAASQLNMINAGRTRVSLQVLELGRGGARALRQAVGHVPAALGAVAATVAPAAHAAPAPTAGPSIAPTLTVTTELGDDGR